MPDSFQGLVFAALTVYADEENVFQNEEISLLEAAAAAISFGCENVEQEADRWHRKCPAGERGKVPAIANYTVDWESWLGPDLKLLWFCRERATGYSESECYAMADYPLPLVAEEDRRRVAETFRESNGSRGEDVEFRIACKDGSVDWVSSLAPIYDANGDFLGYRAGVRDITERKAAASALVLREQQLESFLPGATAGLVLLNKEVAGISISTTLWPRLTVCLPQNILAGPSRGRAPVGTGGSSNSPAGAEDG